MSWFVAFFGTCVAMIEADNLTEARKKAEDELGRGVTTVREANYPDIDWWTDAGGPQLTNDEFNEDDWLEL